MVPLTRPLATGSRFNSGSPIPHHPVKRPNKVTVVEVEDEGEIERPLRVVQTVVPPTPQIVGMSPGIHVYVARTMG